MKHLHSDLLTRPMRGRWFMMGGTLIATSLLSIGIDGRAAEAQPKAVTTHEVRMLGDADGYRYEPTEINANSGDSIRFVLVSGGPHHVAFDTATVSAEFKAVMMRNMPDRWKEDDLSGKMLLFPGESYTISLEGVAPGTYDFRCLPHLAMKQTGRIIVR